MKAVDAKTMQAMDRRAVRAFGMRSIQLMENAGSAVALTVKREFDLCKRPSCRVSIVAGKGNNGGDGFVAARHLKAMGIEARVFLIARPGEIKGDAGVNMKIWQKSGGELLAIASPRDLKKHSGVLKHSSIIVDALFGTGLSSPVKGLYAGVIGLINSLNKKVISIDVPSGIDGSTGAVNGAAVKADITVTMALPKTGLYMYPAREYAGSVEVAGIGFPEKLISDARLRWNITCAGFVKGVIAGRRADSHKGAYGHVLVVAGSPGKSGAAYMAAMGAMRSGAGLATIAFPEGLNPAMEAKTIEVMTLPLPETPDGCLGSVSYKKLRPFLDKASSIVIGPGLGVSKEAAFLVEMLLRDASVPLVIDADGLNVLKANPGIIRKAKAGVVITPHPGEAARLLGISGSDIQSERLACAERLAGITGATVVLKGASTIIADPDGTVFINPTGNPGLSTAGTGDVLSGMIGAFLGRGIRQLSAAAVAVYIHGLAADEIKKTAGEAGMLATDLLARIPAILNSLSAETQKK